MVHRFVVILLAFGWVLALPARPSRAQESARPAAAAKGARANPEYARHYKTGERFLKEGNAEGALAEFRQAYNESPTAEALIRQAVCHKMLADYPKAVAALDLAIEKHGSTMTAQELKELKEKAEEYRRLLGYIEITLDPGDATVTVDKQPLTPDQLAKPVPLSPKEYVIEATRPGHAPFSKKITVTSGPPIPVPVTLRELKGFLTIQVEPNEALVTLNGKPLTPLARSSELPLAPGDYEVAATLAEHEPASKAITLKDNEHATVVLNLRDLFGTLRVLPLSPETKIEVDGEPVGTGKWEHRLPIGPHTVRMVDETLVGTVNIESGKQRDVKPGDLPQLPQPDFRGFYALISGGALIPTRHPKVFRTDDFTVEGASSGGFFGARAGYRLSEYAGLEGLAEYGGITGPRNGAGKFSYAARIVHLGAVLRTYSPGDPVRFVGTVGGGGALHLLEYDDFDPRGFAQCGGDPHCPSGGVDWFLINEVGGEVSIVDGLFLGLSLALILTGTSGVDDFATNEPTGNFGDPYENEVLALFGPRLYLGYGAW